MKKLLIICLLLLFAGCSGYYYPRSAPAQIIPGPELVYPQQQNSNYWQERAAEQQYWNTYRQNVTQSYEYKNPY